MPAYFDTGFSVREPMWHGEGLVLDEYPEDWKDARAKAGLTWEPVELMPYVCWPLGSFTCPTCFGTFGRDHLSECATGKGKIGAEVLPEHAIVTDTGVMVPSPDHKAIARPDNHLVLGMRSDEFSSIYHGAEDEFGNIVHAEDGRASMETIIEAFRDADGTLRFETAGSCREGRQVWALLYLDEPFSVPGDPSQHLSFVAILNNHGGGGCVVTRTQVRVVCWNTFQMALAQGERTGLTFTFRHVGDVASRIAEAKEALAGLRSERAEYLELAAELTQLRVDDKRLSTFLSEFLPSPRENGEQCTDRVHENVERARGLFKSIYTDSITCDGITGNGYGLLQASTEYLDHARAFRSPDTYLGRSILRAEPVKAKALTLIREVCR